MPDETIVVVCVHCGAFREVLPDQSSICTNNGAHSPSLMKPADPEE